MWAVRHRCPAHFELSNMYLSVNVNQRPIPRHHLGIVITRCRLQKSSVELADFSTFRISGLCVCLVLSANRVLGGRKQRFPCTVVIAFAISGQKNEKNDKFEARDRDLFVIKMKLDLRIQTYMITSTVLK